MNFLGAQGSVLHLFELYLNSYMNLAFITTCSGDLTLGNLFVINLAGVN